MTIKEAIRTIRDEARLHPDRSAEFMSDFAEVILNRLDDSIKVNSAIDALSDADVAGEGWRA